MTKYTLSQKDAYEQIFKALNKGFATKSERLQALHLIAQAINKVQKEGK